MASYDLKTAEGIGAAWEDLKRELVNKTEEWLSTLPPDQQQQFRELMSDGVLMADVSETVFPSGR